MISWSRYHGIYVFLYPHFSCKCKAPSLREQEPLDNGSQRVVHVGPFFWQVWAFVFENVGHWYIESHLIPAAPKLYKHSDVDRIRDI